MADTTVQSTDVDQIKQALSNGHLFVTDPATGYQRSLHANCPEHGESSPVYRTERSGEAITRVVFQCPVDGHQFDAAPEQMFLR